MGSLLYATVWEQIKIILAENGIVNPRKNRATAIFPDLDYFAIQCLGHFLGSLLFQWVVDKTRKYPILIQKATFLREEMSLSESINLVHALSYSGKENTMYPSFKEKQIATKTTFPIQEPATNIAGSSGDVA